MYLAVGISLAVAVWLVCLGLLIFKSEYAEPITLYRKAVLVAKQLGKARGRFNWVYNDDLLYINYQENIHCRELLFLDVYIKFPDKQPILVLDYRFSEGQHREVCEEYHSEKNWEDHLDELYQEITKNKLNKFKKVRDIL